jgi:PPM family protein phosphatase
LLGIPMALVDAESEPMKLKSGDIVVAASDGILTLSHKALEELLGFGKNTTADKIAEAVLFAIRRINNERQDNATVGVVKIP